MGWCKSKSKSKEECVIRTGSCGMTNGCKMQSSRINCTPCSSQNRGNWDSVCATSHCPKSNYDFVTSPSACHCGRPKSRSRSRSKSKSRAKSKSKSRSNSKSKKSKTKCDHQHSKTGCKIGCTNKKPCVSCCRGISCPNDGDKKKTKKSKSVGCMGKSKSKTKCKK
ncbi:hypothetical protein PVAND_013328 [Polypedilum vanderplanki]|uniref:Uncharacterized protein n=1 Tax=Polypedilum vanderplanki TaxID=319348 RepID=A0A9J6CQC7_POLVA|nr:hypothetical protein PVAND_013328 [Polypedilum vanderplanki]